MKRPRIRYLGTPKGERMSANPTTGARESTQTINPLKALADFGQSVWLDYIRRSLITTGELARLIQEDGLRGMTSNPAIFEKAIAGSTDYSQALAELSKRNDLERQGHLRAARHPRYSGRRRRIARASTTSTKRRDGYVSLEVSPYLAHKTQETIDEARPPLESRRPREPDDQSSRHARRHSRISAAHQRRHQRQRHAAFRAGCLRASRRGLTSPALKHSRRSGGDVEPHRQRGQLFRQPHRHARRQHARCEHQEGEESIANSHCCASLQGKVAIANAKLAYQNYKEIFSGPRWQALAAARRANAARPVGQHQHQKSSLPRRAVRRRAHRPDTVNTIPPATYDAFRDHGHPRASSRRRCRRRAQDHGRSRPRRASP